MSANPTTIPLAIRRLNLSYAQGVLGAGLVVMYAPSAYNLLNGGLWSTGEHGHGPMMLVVALWLMWKRWTEGASLLPPAPVPRSGWVALIVGALLFMLGRSLGVIQAEAGSAIFMIAGCMLITGGWPLLKAMKFPLFFMIFMIPMPGFIVDPISNVMKAGVSIGAENLLLLFNYPVARTGVILQVGQYQLLVADACAGMRTLLMLEALGILYLNVVRHSSVVRNLGLALLIVPISFTANVVRVFILALITYHWGDDAGQGFLHGFAGMVLFLIALGLTVSADRMFRFVSERAAKVSA